MVWLPIELRTDNFHSWRDEYCENSHCRNYHDGDHYLSANRNCSRYKMCAWMFPATGLPLEFQPGLELAGL